MEEKIYKVLHLFCGIGGGALGFQQAREMYADIRGRFETIAGIDNDKHACIDFEKITGSRAIQMDLFSRNQYIDFHGHEPPEGWNEVHPMDLLKAIDYVYPDVIFLSPPCKGFSGLLPEKQARTKKYQALNELTTRGIFLALEAFKENLPAFILFENVPRITSSRGAKFLKEIRTLLRSYGYVVSDDQFHDCGEIGGLGQSRKRFLLVARNPQKVPHFLYNPPKQPLKSVGDILGTLPMPNEPSAGKMHRLPKLKWKTWVRLALIPAGGDWRDLENFSYTPRAGAYRIIPWSKPSTTVTAATRGVGSSNGASAVADPRLDTVQGYGNKFHVIDWDEPCSTITGGRMGSGAAAVSDKRTEHFNHIYRIVPWDEPAGAVTGAAGVSNGSTLVADPRLDCKPRSGTMGVLDWNEPAKTIIGSGDIHASAMAVADVRIPDENDNGIFVIISTDNTWHRPLTTLEALAIQGFPITFPDGTPVELSGNSDARWRERIGNAVPPPSAKAVGETILRSLLPLEKGVFVLGAEPIWVMPDLANEMNSAIFIS